MDRKIVLSLLILAFLFFSSSLSFGQAEKWNILTGHVRDEKGHPLVGVLVSLVRPPYEYTITGPHGEFTLKVGEDIPAWDLILVGGDYSPFYLTVPIGQKEISVQLFLSPPIPRMDVEGVPILIEAESFAYEEEKDVYRAYGEVVITFKGERMAADFVELRKKADRFIAEGRVQLRNAEGDKLEGRRLEMRVSDKIGFLEQGEIFVNRTHFYLRGPRLERKGESTYDGDQVEVTTCDGVNPDWRITAERLTVTIDGYGMMKNGCFYAKNIPLIYAPYLIFPVKTTRQTGFLLPHRLAYSRDRLGLDLGIPFFWALSPDKDATFYQRFMSQRGFQEGVEFRYLASKSQGTIYAELMQDRKKIKETVGDLTRDWKEEKTRWALYLNQETSWQENLFFRADVARVSDNFYFKDFTSYNYFLANFKPTRGGSFQKVDFFGNESLPYLESTIRLEKSWNKYGLTVLVKNTQDLSVASNGQTLQKYPEIAFMGVKQPLGETPIWFDVSGNYDYFYRREGEKGHLLDVSPSLYLPLRMGRHIRFTPFVGMRSLLWAKGDESKEGTGKTDHREIYLTGATFSTELSRSYPMGEGRSIKHTVQPEFFYLYSPIPTGGEAPSFVPTVSAGGSLTNIYSQTFFYAPSTKAITPLTGDFNLISYAITNFLRWKDASDFLRWKIVQYYDIREARRPEGKPWGDIFSELDISPIKYISVSARNRYDVYDTRWREENYAVTIKDQRGDTASVTYRYTKESVKEVGINVKAVMEKYLDLRFYFRRDLVSDKDVEKGVGIDYRRQCWSLGVDFGESMNDRAVSIRFSLLGL
ncbi:MAG: LPS assembly protein LptD [Syntrophales bacterium]|nr:LPS assembly protein LptD [Syntrophales bacterium]